MSPALPSYLNAHPVKIERHDTLNKLHHTNNGQRQVDHYQETVHGLYVARSFEAHPRIRHWQAHLLPALNLVVCKYQFHDRHEHDFYMDIAQISREGAVWAVRDLYLDLVLQDGHSAEIVDTEELLDSRRAGHISDEDLHEAVEVAHRTLAALARANYSLQAWAQAHGLELEWLEVPQKAGEKADRALHLA